MKKIFSICLLAFIGITQVNAQWSELGGNNALAAQGSILTTCSDAAGNIYAAGGFTNSSNKFYVAKYNGTIWSELGGTNALAANGSIFSICSDATGNIYTAGTFKNAANKYYVAKFNGTSWSELGGFNSLGSFGSTIKSICSDAAGNIYAAGNLTNSGNQGYVAKYDGTSWSELGGTNSLAAQGTINSLCSDAAGNIYAAGDFFNTNNYKKYVAKYDGTSWSELGGTNSLAAQGNIQSLCSDAAGNIYAAGDFRNISGRIYVAKYNGSSWSELGGTNALGAFNTIYSICSDAQGNIYAGGFFANNDGNQYVAKYDGTSWSELGGTNALGVNSIIESVCSDAKGKIYAGGDFTNSSNNKYVAKYAIPCTATTSSTTISACSSYFWAANGQTYTASGTYTKTFIDGNSKGCDSTATLYLTIKQASASTTNTAYCQSQLPVTWNGLSIATAGTYIAHLTNKAGCDSAATLVATLKGGELATVNYLTGVNVTVVSMCASGSVFQIANYTAPNGTWTSTNNSVVTVSPTGSYNRTAQITAVSAGTATIGYTVVTNSGCPSTINAVVTVSTQAAPSAIVGSSTACVGTGTVYSSSPSGGVWSAARGAITTGGVFTPTSAGTVNVQYTLTNAAGCSANATKTVTINTQPSVPSIAFAAGTTGITGSGGYCHNKTFTLVGTPSGGAWAGTGAFSVTNAGVVTTSNTAASGSITYAITDANGCSNSRTQTASVVASCKGINTNQLAVSNEQLVIYPNPAHSTVSFKIKTLIGAGTIVVTDLYGKQLKTQALSIGTNTIDVSSFAKGMYLVSIITEQGKQTQKVVVE